MHIPISLKAGTARIGVYITMNEQPLTSTLGKPTKETYDAFQQAYDVLNRSLFKSELPNCLITLQRRKRTYGYFSAERFGREDGHATDEIALNPAHFRDRPVKEILATLAHEMVHLWQHHFGKAGRSRYHNKQWAEKMKAIGLQPTDTGEEGGKETGDKVHHMISLDGRFDRLTSKLLARGFAITWMEKPRADTAASSQSGGENAETKSKSGKRVKYICTNEQCDQKAWARHEAKLVCGHHMLPMTPS